MFRLPPREAADLLEQSWPKLRRIGAAPRLRDAQLLARELAVWELGLVQAAEPALHFIRLRVRIPIVAFSPVV